MLYRVSSHLQFRIGDHRVCVSRISMPASSGLDFIYPGDTIWVDDDAYEFGPPSPSQVLVCLNHGAQDERPTNMTPSDVDTLWSQGFLEVA